jgi:hypothetical protein
VLLSVLPQEMQWQLHSAKQPAELLHPLLPSLLPQALHSLLEPMKWMMMKQTLKNLSRSCQLQNHQRCLLS